MASLNKYAEQVLLAINRPYDFATHKRIKDLIKQARAERIRQSIERNGIDIHFRQVYHPKLIKVDIADSCVIDIGCIILRTENRIANPIRYKSDVPFLFVGSADENISFTYAGNARELTSATQSKFMSKSPRYMYVNGYLYLYNVTRVKQLAVEALYENPELGTDACNICYFDDMEFPISLDMINSIIKEIVSTGILNATKTIPEVETVPIKEENK